ncbi:MAG: hypothetical protein M1827_000492 [Pycnora praestabilis]|nr:MAG: hypothetical protein M1827_000492 [Pycnora praestabilis]
MSSTSSSGRPSKRRRTSASAYPELGDGPLGFPDNTAILPYGLSLSQQRAEQAAERQAEPQNEPHQIDTGRASVEEESLDDDEIVPPLYRSIGSRPDKAEDELRRRVLVRRPESVPNVSRPAAQQDGSVGHHTIIGGSDWSSRVRNLQRLQVENARYVGWLDYPLRTSNGYRVVYFPDSPWTGQYGTTRRDWDAIVARAEATARRNGTTILRYEPPEDASDAPEDESEHLEAVSVAPDQTTEALEKQAPEALVEELETRSTSPGSKSSEWEDPRELVWHELRQTIPASVPLALCTQWQNLLATIPSAHPAPGLRTTHMSTHPMTAGIRLMDRPTLPDYIPRKCPEIIRLAYKHSSRSVSWQDIAQRHGERDAYGSAALKSAANRVQTYNDRYLAGHGIESRTHAWWKGDRKTASKALKRKKSYTSSATWTEFPPVQGQLGPAEFVVPNTTRSLPPASGARPLHSRQQHQSLTASSDESDKVLTSGQVSVKRRRVRRQAVGNVVGPRNQEEAQRPGCHARGERDGTQQYAGSTKSQSLPKRKRERANAERDTDEEEDVRQPRRSKGSKRRPSHVMTYTNDEESEVNHSRTGNEQRAGSSEGSVTKGNAEEDADIYTEPGVNRERNHGGKNKEDNMKDEGTIDAEDDPEGSEDQATRGLARDRAEMTFDGATQTTSGDDNDAVSAISTKESSTRAARTGLATLSEQRPSASGSRHSTSEVDSDADSGVSAPDYGQNTQLGIPRTEQDHYAIYQRMEPTRAHFGSITGREGTTDQWDNYASQYGYLQSLLDRWWQGQGRSGQAPLLATAEFEQGVWRTRYPERGDS